MALIRLRSSRRMNSIQRYHSPRLKSSRFSPFFSEKSRTASHIIALVVNTALIYSLLGLIGVAGQDKLKPEPLFESEPISLKLLQLEQVEPYLLIPASAIGATTAESYASLRQKIEQEESSSDSNHIPNNETIIKNQQSHSSVSEAAAAINSTTVVPNSFLNSAASAADAIIKSDANSTVATNKDNENAAHSRELITNNNATTISMKSATNEIPDVISTWTNDSLTSTSTESSSSLLFYEESSSSSSSESTMLLHSDNKKLGINHNNQNEVALIKSVPISSSFASSVSKSRRPKRSVVHLYDMVVCSTGCNPLAYKGYGCYCGFLGSGLIVDGIDKCCAKHDWCYHHAKCPPLLTYFVPYYWTCNDGRPKCVNDYRGWKGICGAHLCECDRQFAECLRKYPCPRGRAVCLSSPFRNPVNNYHYNYNYIDDPDIHYYYS